MFFVDSRSLNKVEIRFRIKESCSYLLKVIKKPLLPVFQGM